MSAQLLIGMLLLALIGGCSDHGDDLLVLQDGGRRTGTLQGCLDGGCRLSGRAIPQATITWIGLHQGRASPPQPTDPAVAEIRMLDHSVHPGLMTAIDATRVLTGLGSYDRQKVAWVYLPHRNKSASGAPTTGPPTGSRVVYVDVDVDVRIDTHTQSPGVLDATEEWTGAWKNVAVTMMPDRPPYLVIGTAIERERSGHTRLRRFSGVVQASARFTYNDPPNIFRPTNCQGELPTQTYTGRFNLDWPPRDGGIQATPDVPGSVKFNDAIRAVIASRCGAGWFKVSVYPAVGNYFNFATPDGVRFDFSGAPALMLRWGRVSDPASGLPFPLDEIVAGKSVTLESGTQCRVFRSYGRASECPPAGTDVGYAQKVDEAVRVSFTPAVAQAVE